MYQPNLFETLETTGIIEPTIKEGDTVHYTYRGKRGGGKVVEIGPNTLSVEPMVGSYRIIKVKKEDAELVDMILPSGDRVVINHYNKIVDHFKDVTSEFSPSMEELNVLARKMGVANPNVETIRFVEKYCNIYWDNNRKPIVRRCCS